MPKDKKLFVSFILDETGSMLKVKQLTISGFNEYVATLKGEDNADSIRFTLTQFNSNKVEVVLSGVKIKDVPELTNDTYNPREFTPLYDAIGRTIRSIEDNVTGKKQRVLVVIQTDGLENASTEYSQKDIFDLIEEKKKLGWSFVFLGADQDAWIASKKIGVGRMNTMSYNGLETKNAFAVTAVGTISYTRSDGKQTEDFFKDQADQTKKDKDND